MSSFTNSAFLEVLDDFRFRLIKPFEYYVGNPDAPDAVYTVPAGFETDFASVPRWMWSFLPPTGRYTKAAILHDYLVTPEQTGPQGYSHTPVPRDRADELFYESMLVLGVKPHLAWLMYQSVRLYSIYHKLRLRYVGSF